jgi:hypothetical protein
MPSNDFKGLREKLVPEKGTGFSPYLKACRIKEGFSHRGA